MHIGEAGDQSPPEQSPRLYDDLAFLWPTLSPRSDYQPEAAWVLDTMSQHLESATDSADGTQDTADRPTDDRTTILELGSGGGHTLHYLAEQCDTVAVDLSPSMLAISEQLNPGTEHHVGDMRSIRLNRQFDAVLIHDAIDYLLTEQDIVATFETAWQHLRPGGLLLVAPTYLAETFPDQQSEQDVRHDTESGLEVAYVSHVRQVSQVNDSDPSDHVFDFTMVITYKQDGRLQVVEDHHRCGLFSIADWQRMLSIARFELLREPTIDTDGLDSDDEIPFDAFVSRKPKT